MLLKFYLKMLGYNLFNFSILLFITVFCIGIILDPNNFSGNQFKKKKNDFCSSKQEGFDELVCKNELKKKKFIWIFIDGLAYDQLYFLEQKKKKKEIALFNVFSETYRQSGALHETLLTGKFSRNFIGKKIQIDQIMKQSKNAGFKINYVGIQYPLVYLNGDDNKIFDRIFVKSPDYFPFSSLCDKHPTFNENIGSFNDYENENYDEKSRLKVIKGIESSYSYIAGTEDINQCLRDCDAYHDKNNSSSLVFYSQYIDHLNHAYYKYFPKTIANTLKFEEGILSFIKWVDENPDYVLFVSSDHGGQNFRGEDNFCNHGCIDFEKHTNGAFFMMYYKNMEFNDENIDYVKHVDITPTLAQVLEDVNIPLESTGFPLKFHNNLLLNLVQVRSKEIQMTKLIKAFIKDYPSQTKDAEGLLDKLQDNPYYRRINKMYNSNKVASLNETLYIQYKEFVIECENHFHKVIFKKTGNKFTLIAIFLLFVKIIYLLKNSFRTSNLDFIDSSFKKITLTTFLYLILNLDYIFLFIFKENVEAAFGIENTILCVLIGLFLFLYYFWKKKLYNYSNLNHIKGNMQFYLFFLVLGVAVAIFMINNTYFKLKGFFAFHYELKYFDVITYTTIFGYCITAIREIKPSFYRIRSNINIKLDIVHIILQTILFAMMVAYDAIVHIRKYIVSEDKQTQNLALTIYIYNMFYTIFILLNIKTYDEKQKMKFYSSRLIKIVMLPLLFFISDTIERIYLIIFILPIFHCLNLFLRKYKRTDPILKFFIIICMIRVGDLIFYLTKGTYTFDVSLESANKTISGHPDITPIISGFFFGLHKAKLFIICALFLLDIMKFKNYDLNELGSFFANILDIKTSISLIFYFSYLYFDIQTLYLSSFMMYLTKSIALMLFLMFILKAALFRLIFDGVEKIYLFFRNRNKSNRMVDENTIIEINDKYT